MPDACSRCGADWRSYEARRQAAQMQPRRLTAGERAIGWSLFKSVIPYDTVILYPYLPEDKLAELPRALAYSARGLMLDGNIYLKAAPADVSFHVETGDFVHELTHVWQHHLARLGRFSGDAEDVEADGGGDYFRGYDYDIRAHDELFQFNREQQACIVSDYFMQEIRHAHRTPFTGDQFRYVLRRMLADPSMP